MNTHELFQKYFGNTTSVNTNHPNMEKFFQELNDECVKEDRKKKNAKVKTEICINFGKNGMGLTDELTKIGKKVEKWSKDNHVYIQSAFIDQADDVYQFKFTLLKRKVCKNYKTCKKQERYKPHCSKPGIHKCFEITENK